MNFGSARKVLGGKYDKIASYSLPLSGVANLFHANVLACFYLWKTFDLHRRRCGPSQARCCRGRRRTGRRIVVAIATVAYGRAGRWERISEVGDCPGIGP
jgi:hypothetical protein